MKMKFLLNSLLILFVCSTAIASDDEMGKIRCATVEYVNRLRAENPNYLENKQKDELLVQQLLLNQAQSRANDVVYTIPVVVHVLYRTTAQNISDAQIMSQIDVLNEDFARLNADTALTPSFFRSIAGTSNFQFCLAATDPLGNPTNGIERRSTTSTSFNTNNNVKHYSSGGLDAWDVNRYFNIWVCNLGSGLLGYAEPPSGTHSDEYGVVILYDSFGRVGNVSTPYHKGRTTTHEIGHAFGMEHIWGDDSNCSGSDGISDTPNQEVETYGCPSTLPSFDNCSSSGNGIMYMNYMDYTDDLCMNMFTTGQTNRMKLLMEAYYPTLLVSTACTITSSREAADKFSFSIYPNPSDGLVNLDMFLMENVGSNLTISVSNLLGEIVKSEQISNPNGRTHQLNLGDQGSGIYFISVFNDNFKKTVRLELIN
ncbi:MAG: T9SS type A sorting domain-containing protein [Bacteroidetes bacterium]|nr:MAG: T9SS type A sorting domain-containing protein [Bacteroidota bacterium]